jgi:RimJ/RimL family protein N-acetyltransferase
MDTAKHIELEDARVKLIPLQKEHFNDLIHFSEKEPDLWEYSLVPGNGQENLTNYISKALLDRENGNTYAFVVFDKKYKRIVGSTRFYDIQPQHETTQLGFTWYGKKYQGTGINRACKFLLLEYAFENMNVQRVEFRADANNARSISAMKKIGCTPEGILRSNCASPTGRRNSIILSILQSEWYSSVKKDLKPKYDL